MIVEMIGSPGVGKSTLCRYMVEHDPERYGLIRGPRFDKLVLIIKISCLCVLDRTYYRLVIAAGQKKKNLLKLARRIFIDMYKIKKAYHLEISDPTKIYLLEENILKPAREGVLSRKIKIKNIKHLLPKCFVVCTADPDIIISRANKRQEESAVISFYQKLSNPRINCQQSQDKWLRIGQTLKQDNYHVILLDLNKTPESAGNELLKLIDIYLNNSSCK